MHAYSTDLLPARSIPPGARGTPTPTAPTDKHTCYSLVVLNHFCYGKIIFTVRHYTTQAILCTFVNYIHIQPSKSNNSLDSHWKTHHHQTCTPVLQNYNSSACSPTFHLISPWKNTTVQIPQSLESTLPLQLPPALIPMHTVPRRRLMDVGSQGWEQRCRRDGTVRAEWVRGFHSSQLGHKFTSTLLGGQVWGLYKSYQELLRNFPVKHVSMRKRQFITRKKHFKGMCIHLERTVKEPQLTKRFPKEISVAL